MSEPQQVACERAAKLALYHFDYNCFVLTLECGHEVEMWNTEASPERARCRTCEQEQP